MTTRNDTVKSSLLPDNLVSTTWLHQHLFSPQLCVVDIRGYVKTIDLGDGHQRAEYVGAPEEYEQAHIPGSVFVDWTIDIVDLDNPVKAQIAPPARFQDAMERRGIGDTTDVIAIDHTGGHFATRLWWALRYYGHDRVAVLDGGFNKWQAEELPLTSEKSVISPAHFTPRVRPELRVEPEEVLAGALSAGTRIVDARDTPTYTGEVFRGVRGGHIPGAVNIPAKSLVNSDGTWKSADELRQILENGGVGADQRVISYCNGGVTATGVLFALERTGHQNYANYDGSWNEWGAREDLPAETGTGNSTPTP